MSAIDPNRYAAPAEAALLRQHIALDEAAQPAIQQRIVHSKTALHDALYALRVAQEAVGSAQTIHDEVLAIHAALEQRLRRARGLLHPIRRVPDDVLSMIFLEWMDMARGDWSPATTRTFRVGLLAAAVCAHWRRAALHLPALWHSIKLDLDLVGQGDAATWTDYITTSLARSSATPIELDVSGPPENVESQDFWAAVSRSFGKAASIGLVLSGDRPNHRLNRCFFQHAPFLEEFSLGYDLANEYDSACHVPFFLSAPLLRDFDWQGPRLSWPLGASTYPAVTYAHIFTTHMDAESLGILLSRMPNIRTLTTMSRNFTADSTPATFALSNSALDDLHLISSGLDADVMRRITFPSLRCARVELNGGELAPDVVTAILRHTMPRVQRLEIPISAALDLIPGLRSSTQLRFLSLVEYADSAEQFFDELAQPGAGGMWLCPQLEELLLPADNISAPVRQSILRVARARGRRAPVDRKPPNRLLSIRFDAQTEFVGTQFVAEVEEALGDSESVGS